MQRRVDRSDTARGRPDSVAEVAKRHGMSKQSIHCCRKGFGEFGVDEVRWLKAVEAENTRLLKLLVERDLDIEAIKMVNSRNWGA